MTDEFIGKTRLPSKIQIDEDKIDLSNLEEEDFKEKAVVEQEVPIGVVHDAIKESDGFVLYLKMRNFDTPQFQERVFTPRVLCEDGKAEEVLEIQSLIEVDAR